MKKYILIICSLLLVAVYSCNDTEEEQELRSVANSIYATFDDGSGFFNPEASTPYGDVITIAVPHYYPEESDNVSDITSMKLKANYPVTITYTDGTEVDMIDLTKETTIVITAADGTQTTHKVTGVIEKSQEAAIEEFRLPDANLDGYVVEDQKVIGLVPGVDPQATPACVNACPTGARIFGDLNDPDSQVSKILNEHAHFRLRDDLGTGPRVYYLPASSEEA